MVGELSGECLFMFLITTADTRTWDSSGKVLFLGEWCRRYDLREQWRKMDHEVQPYHWDDRERLYRDYQYIHGLQERYLEVLAGRLNEIHGVDYALHYWRIVLGWWLHYFIAIAYDRYLSVRQAIDSGQITSTLILKSNEKGYVPLHMKEFMHAVFSDDYNNYLYSIIIRRLGGLAYKEKTVDSIVPNTSTQDAQSGMKEILRRILNFYSKKVVPDCYNRIVFTNNLSILKKFKLQFQLGQAPYLSFSESSIPNFQLDQVKRRVFDLSFGYDEFTILLDQLIAEQIPKIYLEGYSAMQTIIQKDYPKQAYCIVYDTAYESQEGFKFWSAQQVMDGAKMVGVQHGGHYGTGLWSGMESYETSISDRYFTWGWKDANQTSVAPPNLGKLNDLKKVPPELNGHVLLVSYTLPRYAYHMYSAPVGPQMLTSVEEQVLFMRSVLPKVRQSLLVRLHQADDFLGWGIKERFEDNGLDVEISEGKRPMRQDLQNCRICICTYNATVYLERFAENFPTLIFWNPKYWELRPEAVPYFDDLRKAGILHDTPESAANKLNEIFDDTLSWWFQNEVQAAKNRFSQQFARVEPDGLRPVLRELRTLGQQGKLARLVKSQ